jgi:hypothetical protein
MLSSITSNPLTEPPILHLQRQDHEGSSHLQDDLAIRLDRANEDQRIFGPKGHEDFGGHGFDQEGRAPPRTMGLQCVLFGIGVMTDTGAWSLM